MIDLSNADVSFAIDAVTRAADLGKTVQQEMANTSFTKSDRTPVSIADFAIQALVGHLLEEERPDETLVAEEEAEPLQAPERSSTLEQVRAFTERYVAGATADDVCEWIERGNDDPEERFWTLDPVDGTKGFLRGDQFAVALALIEDGTVQVGVLGCPNLDTCHREDPEGDGSLLIGVRGEGAYWRPLFREASFQELSTSDVKNSEEAVMLRSFESAHTNVEQLEALSRHLGLSNDPVKMDSQAKYAVLAAGGGDLLYRLLSKAQPGYKEKIWDQAPGAVVLEEAGGKLTDLDGRPLDFTTGRRLTENRGVLATNGHLHDRCLKAIRDVEKRV